MRKQIAAANWKMNLTLAQAEELLKDILAENIKPGEDQEVIFAVPFPYLMTANKAASAVVRFQKKPKINIAKIPGDKKPVYS